MNGNLKHVPTWLTYLNYSYVNHQQTIVHVALELCHEKFCIWLFLNFTFSFRKASINDFYAHYFFAVNQNKKTLPNRWDVYPLRVSSNDSMKTKSNLPTPHQVRKSVDITQQLISWFDVPSSVAFNKIVFRSANQQHNDINL